MTDALQTLRDAKKIAFVFSGGSSRCAFQIGAVETLLDLGIKPSMCFGVSGGAWNAAALAVGNAHRLRYYWKTFCRMPHIDIRNLWRERSPFRFAAMHDRTFSRFVGAERIRSEGTIPLVIVVTRLRDRVPLYYDARFVDDPLELMLATNYLPPFYTHAPRIEGERCGDGGVTDNVPYEKAFGAGCDAVVIIHQKGESEGGFYKSTRDVDHHVPQELASRVIAIRPRHRLPISFTERDWGKLSHLADIGALRAREVLLGENHPETDIRAKGDSPSLRIARLLRRAKARA